MYRKKRSSKTSKASAGSKKIENILAFAKVLVEVAKLIWEIISWWKE
jgi:hypothetical protein